MALKEQGHLDKMKNDGIKWIASYIIDNILALVCDPLFLGFSIDNEYVEPFSCLQFPSLDIASKVVPKISPTERVGVLALRNNRYTVLEYTEICEEKRVERNEKGDLVYDASHLVINNFKLDFVDTFCKDLINTLPYVTHDFRN